MSSKTILIFATYEHLLAYAKTDEGIKDDSFGVTANNLIGKIMGLHFNKYVFMPPTKEIMLSAFEFLELERLKRIYDSET